MPEGRNVVQTRQRPEVFYSTSIPLGAGQSHIPVLALVAGYDGLKILAVADQAFEIRIEEGSEVGGLFAVSETYVSSLVGFSEQICEIHKPCGTYVRITLENTSGVGMRFLEATVSGVAVT